MKQMLLLACVAICLISCSSKSTENKENTDTQMSESNQVLNIEVYTLDSLLVVADQYVDKTVTVKGSVTHTCKHSGKRCFIVGDDPNVSIRVEAKGNIGGFNRELVGSELAITGVLKERRLTQEYIDQYEKDIKEKKVEENGSAETCDAELANINAMREWMKNNNKDYYALYFIDGEEFSIVE